MDTAATFRNRLMERLATHIESSAEPQSQSMLAVAMKCHLSHVSVAMSYLMADPRFCNRIKTSFRRLPGRKRPTQWYSWKHDERSV